MPRLSVRLLGPTGEPAVGAKALVVIAVHPAVHSDAAWPPGADRGDHRFPKLHRPIVALTELYQPGFKQVNSIIMYFTPTPEL